MKGQIFRLGIAVVVSSFAASLGLTQEPSAAPTSTRVDQARRDAMLMHDIYSATLDVMHDRYFRNDRSTIPARAMEDVFSQVARQRKIQAHWIGVNAKTMSINHEPKTDFEKDAAQAISAGKGEFEQVHENHYRRATAIPLAAGCLSCHGTFGVEAKTPRFAGLIIDIPLRDSAIDK